jgi:uncharacterized protein (TIGR03435 family)
VTNRWIVPNVQAYHLRMNTGITLLAALGVSLFAFGQTPAASQAPAQFEVASVKPNMSGDSKAAMQTPPGRFTATNVTLRQLIREAYHLQEFQITGGPNWLDRDRFDIVAKAEGPESPEGTVANRVPLMLRALLAERFGLGVHIESKELPIYALIPARADGMPGAQLKRAAPACDPPSDGSRGGTTAPANRAECGLRILPGTMMAGGVTMAELAEGLSPLMNRVVHDRTGLAGRFAFTLRWTPEQVSEGLDRKARAMGLPPIDRDGPALVTAVQEQLGLKLDSQRGPVDVLVVDRADRPREN